MHYHAAYKQGAEKFDLKGATTEWDGAKIISDRKWVNYLQVGFIYTFWHSLSSTSLILE
jgi:hypothetical protein